MKLINIVRKAEEIKKDSPKPTKEKHVFQLFFFKDDEDQRVQVAEVKDIDFAEVMQHLNQGKSIFIMRKHTRERSPKSRLGEDPREPWYFIHI